VSIPVCIATVIFYIAFRLGEDYLLTPRIIGRAVKGPAGVTIVAVLLGAAWLGIVGALVAIPVAAACSCSGASDMSRRFNLNRDDLVAVFEDGVGAGSSGIDMGYDECDLSMKWQDPSARLRQYSNVPKVVSLHSNKEGGFPWALKRSRPRRFP
jgi:hypothetical protein